MGDSVMLRTAKIHSYKPHYADQGNEVRALITECRETRRRKYRATDPRRLSAQLQSFQMTMDNARMVWQYCISVRLAHGV